MFLRNIDRDAVWTLKISHDPLPFSIWVGSMTTCSAMSKKKESPTRLTVQAPSSSLCRALPLLLMETWTLTLWRR